MRVAAATVRKGRCAAAGYPPAYPLRVRYWRSQPIAGAAACCDSSAGRFAHLSASVLSPQPARTLVLRLAMQDIFSVSQGC